MDREVSVTYGGLTLGGTSTAYRLTDAFAFKMSTDTISLQANVIVQGTSEAAFLAAESALLAVFNKPNGTLVVTLGVATRYTFSHAANTGMNGRAEANKAGSDLDSGLAALYVVSIQMERPWDFSGDGGLRVASINCSTGASNLRTLTVSGQYSATSGNSAYANYSNVSTGAEAVASAWKSTFAIDNSDRIAASAIPDKYNKACDFSHTYVELAFAKTTSGHVTTFKDPRISYFARQHQFGAYSSTARQPVEIEITYAAVVCFAEPVTLQTIDLKAFVVANLDPKVFAYVRAVNDASGPLCVLERRPSFSPFDNQISVSYRMIVYPSGVIDQSVTVAERADAGEQLTAVWDNDEFSKEVQPVPRTWDRVISIEQAVLQDGPVSSSSDLVVVGTGGTIDAGIQIVKELDSVDNVGVDRFRVVFRERVRSRQFIGLVPNSASQGEVVRVTKETWLVGLTRVNLPKDGIKSGQRDTPDTGGAPTNAGNELINTRTASG